MAWKGNKKALQEKRNKAVVAQRQAKLKSGIGSPAHRKAIETTKSLGRAMEDRPASDKSKAAFSITIKNVDEYVAPTGKLKKKTSVAPTGTRSKGDDTTTSGIPPVGTWTGTKTSPDVRGGYDPSGSVDYTNTNPAYWTSVLSYFKARPNGNPATGELGIWIPNFEKEGAERTALAAIAGGITAHVNSNYANRTVTDAERKTATESFRGGPAEKAIRLAGTHRGGVLTDTGYDMGSTAPSEHGVHIKGGKVVKAAGADYVKGGGDFGGLISFGDTITGDWLTGLLGPMDSDGMRTRGTYPIVRGSSKTDPDPSGVVPRTKMGGFYPSGKDPLAGIPKVADYTAYMDPNSIFGGLGSAAAKSGLLYQPEKLDYGAKMKAAGMPTFSPGLLGDKFVGAGPPKYSSPPGDFMKKKAADDVIKTTAMAGDPRAKYALPEMYGDYKFSRIPTFYNLAALEAAGDVWRSRGGPWKDSPWPYDQKALVAGHQLYTTGGSGIEGGEWGLTRSYPLAKTTT